MSYYYGYQVPGTAFGTPEMPLEIKVDRKKIGVKCFYFTQRSWTSYEPENHNSKY